MEVTLSTTTTAAVAEPGVGEFAWRTVVLDDPRPDEVLVRIVATSLCHTDLTVLAGRQPTQLPAVLGHESAGVVEAVGAGVTLVRPGDQVLLTFNSCGHCPRCRTGAPTQCESFFARNFSGRREDGTAPIHGEDGAPIGGQFFGQSSLAHHALVSEHSVVPVEAADDDELAALAPVNCGVQAGAGTVLNVLRPQPGDSIAVFGAGAVGLSAVLAARLTAATTIIAVDIIDSRLKLAGELGAQHLVNSTGIELPATLRDLTGGTGPTHIVETTGVPPLLEQAIEAIASHGTVAVVGAPGGDARASFNINAMIDGRTVRGVTCGASDRINFIPTLVELHRQGRLPFDRMIRTYTPDQLGQAVADARSGHTLKPVIRFARQS
ncbi:MAG TPA: NAD(P)-dependent alcohol dehydrogenase [Pseudonocardia sp.]|jgi:aryl-alcohol dehydrogenase|nr:NAD(P)-dependent alcohol dehydrogenase [Pseudonocardia sp.]